MPVVDGLSVLEGGDYVDTGLVGPVIVPGVGHALPFADHGVLGWVYAWTGVDRAACGAAHGAEVAQAEEAVDLLGSSVVGVEKCQLFSGRGTAPVEVDYLKLSSFGGPGE